MKHTILRELRFTARAILGGWPGLLLALAFALLALLRLG